ncbi:MAG TPA: hypothetical protein VL988_03050 [Solirubrobacteraceae bacterium]|nr:hypothetical protein [Solirubrobacteraceae bacterium]
MRSCFRYSLLALIIGALVAVSASTAQAFGIKEFFAANCNASSPNCKKPAKPEEEKAAAEAEGYTKAGGHPPFGVTDFTVDTHVIQTVPFEAVAPEGLVDHVRTDVAPGLSTNPQAVAKCSAAEFGDTELSPGTGAFPEPKCPVGSVIGENKVVVLVEPSAGVFANVPLSGTVYNLQQSPGLASEFGVALSLEPLGKPGVFAHTIIEGHVEWATDYHDYFEINVSPELPLISSRLSFKGNIGEGKAPFGSGGFLTNATSCLGAGPATTSKLTLQSEEGATAEGTYTTPIGIDECDAVPFGATVGPTFGLTTDTLHSDAPDGITTSVTEGHDLSPTGTDSSQVKSATVVLPEGLTINPSAAHEVTDLCKPSQIGIGTRNPVACPAASKIGSVTLDVPGLPTNEEEPESLHGTLYLGGPESGPITKPPYVMYIDAESARYGLSVRLKGLVEPNLSTGRLTAKFGAEADEPGRPPEQPFSNLVLHFNTGQNAPLANPLACGAAASQATFTPFAVPENSFSPSIEPFVVDAPGGGACPATPPFAVTQATGNQTPNAGGKTSYTFALARPEGNQYVSTVKTTLPAGLVGAIPTVTQCGEADANAGTCPAASQIGEANVTAGSGSTPYLFKGPVYLTGPYKGAPFGLSIAVPAVAGPFNLGTVVTRSTIDVDPYTARVTATTTLPRIQQGVPLRLRNINVAINKQGFLYNPTNCGTLATETTLTGFIAPASDAGSTQNLSSPFQVGNCNLLKFKPAFKAVTSSKTSKANGASLETTLNEVPGQANVKSVKVQLPKALPSRLTTLQKACPAATFEADYRKCPSGSFVGGARANTPTLPGKLSGPAILVSHANLAFPDLVLVMEANGVRSILVGNTDIKNGITTTTFASTPDVPVSSITVNLPVGGHSALAANGNLCANPLIMPTTMTGQNGTVVKQNTVIKVNTCGVRVVGHRVVGNTAYITLQTFAPGRISAKGASLATRFRKLARAQKKVTIKVPLTRRAQGKRKPFRVKVRVGFVPKAKGQRSSVSFVTVRF